MYTCNFYRTDEVCAALQLTISKHRYKESLFWVKELLESKEFEKLFETLFITWFYNIGLGNAEVLQRILTINIQNESDVYNLVYGMTMLKDAMRDCTLPIMFLYGVSDPVYKSRNIYFELPSNLIQSNPKIETFIRAVLLGKYLEAWLIYQTVDVSNYINILIETKFKNSDILNCIAKLQSCDMNHSYKMCALIGLMCCKEDNLIKSFGCIKTIDSDSIQLIAQYNSLVGKRKRRVLQIPKDCLYGKTKRGNMTYQESNIKELYDTEYIIENSKIFETILEHFGSYEQFVEDPEQLEKFINWYFPDDVPDEWSRVDQEKSHGFGVNQSHDKPMIRRYFTRWVDLKSNCKIWDKETVVNCILQKIQNNFDTFYIEKELQMKYNNLEKLKKESDSWNFKNLKYVLSNIE